MGVTRYLSTLQARQCRQIPKKQSKQIPTVLKKISSDEGLQKVLSVADVLIEALQSYRSCGEEIDQKLCTVFIIDWKKILSPFMSKEMESIRKMYDNVEELQMLDSKALVMQFNPGIVAFVSGVTGKTLTFETDKQFWYRDAITLEALYNLKMPNVVLPHCFVKNLIQTTLSGSKTVTQVNGKLLPGSGDTLIRTWLKSHGSLQLNTPSHGNIAVWFHNISKYILKSYRVNSCQNNSPTVYCCPKCFAEHPK